MKEAEITEEKRRGGEIIVYRKALLLITFNYVNYFLVFFRDKLKNLDERSPPY